MDMQNQNGVVRSNEFELAIVYRISDVFIIIAVLAGLSWLKNGSFDLAFQLMGVGLSAIYLVVAESFNLYRSWRVSSLKEQAMVNLWVWIVSIALLFAVNYFLKISATYSRVVVGSWVVATPMLLMAWRLVFRESLAVMRRFGYNTRRAAIIGVSQNGVQLKETFENSEELGIQFVGFFDDRDASRLTDSGYSGPVAKVDTALEMAKRGEVDHVYIALPMHAKDRITGYLQQLSDTTTTTFIVPDFFTYNLLHSRWSSLGDIQTVSVFDSPFRGGSMLVKRIQDIVLASIIILLISPLLLAVAVGVKRSSPGPILFKQDRYGLDGKKIRVWKFRSMSTQDNGAVVKQATKNDPRVTKFGAFIRRTSLDELPQFFNVLMGSMSIVGPRPHAVSHNEEYRQIVNRYMLRHKVKPGITGWAQINGYRGETDTLEKMEKRVQYDLEYIRVWTLWMDIKIVFLTIFKGFVGKTAY
ncbi:undecaprenyl-phosphate glucose phosphotransferase [Agarivorans aestuarii]|uniref:Undecaprenyl-phosphate glucose phosphotransferase n=1 Tax=Agarivorans aestuarii TaxID=1563703 RepID=A0ABU7G2I9_9ALTE|nr:MULTISPECIES: undecaprenyl-phosphate glucose phosphotransferase [Agarivorans]MEE1672670.1 undecaprenyl-phosphate glucose phosphotransferase [Agarivorans aestuarii]